MTNEQNKPGFTPGQWEQYGLAIQAGGKDIAYMGVPAQYAGDTPNMCHNWKPNMQLIEAAPELYEVVEAFVAEWDKGTAEKKTKIADMFIHVRNGRAALAKARGESTQ